MLEDDEDEEYDDDEPLIGVSFIDLQPGEEGYGDEDYMD